MPVEPARAQQCRVEDFGTVGCGHKDHPHLCIEPVHLGEELVQGLLALVMTAGETCALALPRESSSSMKMMHGAFCLA